MTDPFIIDADLKKESYIKKIKVTSNDTNTFVVNVFDDGEPLDLTDVTTVSIAHTRPDKEVVVKDGTKTGLNQVSFELGTTETAINGRVKAVVQLYDAEGRVSTLGFTYEVVKDPTGDGFIGSETEQTLIQIVLGDGPLIIEEAQTAADYANTQGDYALQVAVDNETRFLNAVSSVALRDSTYPTPAHGDTVRVTETSTTYRYVSGEGWVITDVYNPTAIDEVTAQLADIAISVKSFGAKGDGITDDTIALQQTFNSVGANGRIIIPSGVYVFDQLTIKPTVGLIVQGDGKGRTVLKSKSNGYSLKLERLNVSSKHIFNTQIRDLTIDGGFKATEVQCLAHFTSFLNVEIKNHTGYNLLLEAQSCIVNGCHLTATQDANMTSPPLSTLYVKWNAHKIQNNYFNAQLVCPAILIDNVVAGYNETLHMIVENNTIESTKGSAIQVSGTTRNLKIMKNYFETVDLTCVGVKVNGGNHTNLSIIENLMNETAESILIDKVDKTSTIEIKNNALYRGIRLLLPTANSLNVYELPNIVTKNNSVIYGMVQYLHDAVSRPSFTINDIYGFSNFEVDSVNNQAFGDSYKTIKASGFLVTSPNNTPTNILGLYVEPGGGATYAHGYYIESKLRWRKSTTGSNFQMEYIEKSAITRNTGTFKAQVTEDKHINTEGVNVVSANFVMDTVNKVLNLQVTGQDLITNSWIVDLEIKSFV